MGTEMKSNSPSGVTHGTVSRAKSTGRSRPSRGRQPGERHHHSRREELLSGLEEIFFREGYRRVTVGELAARLHCSRRALYRLAASKEELFVLILDRMLCRIRQQSDEGIARAGDSAERITAMIRPGITEPMACTASFFADIAGLPAAKQLLEQHQEASLQQLRELIEEGVGSKECRDLHAEVAAQAMLAAYRAITDPRFLMTVDVSLGEALQEAQDLFLHGLLHPA